MPSKVAQEITAQSIVFLPAGAFTLPHTLQPSENSYQPFTQCCAHI